MIQCLGMELIRTSLPWIILGISIIIIIVTLMQSSDASLGSAFGGGDSSLHRTRRGFEKFLFVLTIILSIIFVALVVLSLYLKTR